MHSQFAILTAVWFVLFSILALHFWRKRSMMSGIALTHTVIFTSAHALQGLVYTIPWYVPEWSPEVVLSGLTQSLIAFASLTFGYLFVIPVIAQLISHRRELKPERVDTKHNRGLSPFLQQNLAKIYIIIGFTTLALNWLLRSSSFRNTATISTFFDAMARLFVIGLALAVFSSLSTQRVKHVNLAFVGLGVMFLIVFTVAGSGFIGIVLPPIAFLIIVTVSRLRKPALVIPLSMVALYLGLSVIVTYYTQRDVIRGSVWGGASIQDNLTVTQDALINQFELFDINNPLHLRVIDGRFSLNRLIGLSVERLDYRVVDFAYGQTLLDALINTIPRILWPDKPVVVGGNALVRFYTGLYFNERTAVALGQVLEFYVNFGTAGVILGFIGLSGMIYIIDRGVARTFQRSDLMATAVWISPAFSLWLVEDNYATAVGGAFSTILSIAFVNIALRIIFSEHEARSMRRQNTSTDLFHVDSSQH